MSKKNKKSNENRPESDFGLGRPTGKVSKKTDVEVRPSREEEVVRRTVVNDPSLPHAGWKGLEEGGDDDGGNEDNVDFAEGGFRSDGDMDMTPMVDVTFLLLIFFMITASFSLMRALDQPPPDTEQPSENVVEKDEEEHLDYCEVIIDQNNSFFVTNRGEEEVEAPSETEMRALIRNANTDYNIEKLLITAHVDSLHSKFVAVWDAGLAAKMTEIKSRTTEEDY